MPDPSPPPITRSHLRIHNQGQELLELIIEPWANDYWLHPDETVVITTTATTNPYPGTTYPDEPFEIDYHAGRSLVVHCNGSDAYVTDTDGNRLDCGHQRPQSRRELTTEYITTIF